MSQAIVTTSLHSLFPSFSPELIRYLEDVGTVTTFEAGELIMRPGQYFRSSLLVLDGRVKLYRDGDDGEEFFLYYLENGNACALSMICATRNEVSEIKAKAVTDVKALAIPIQYMDGLMRDHKSWYYFVLETYRLRFEELLTVIDQVAFHSMDEKLELYLKRQFSAFGSDKISTTHQEIADDLNSSREVITRLSKKLESEKRISVSRNEITRLKL
jgi:CRP/FNR family transcriptional regulator